MSTEMWDFDDNGELYFENFVNRFVKVDLSPNITDEQQAS